MIKIIPVPDPGPVAVAVIAVSPDVFDALRTAVEVAFDDPESIPDAYKEQAAELWEAFHAGRSEV